MLMECLLSTPLFRESVRFQAWSREDQQLGHWPEGQDPNLKHLLQCDKHLHMRCDHKLKEKLQPISLRDCLMDLN